MDCINECLDGKIKKTYHNCFYSFPPRYILWRNDSAYSSYQDLKMCQYDDDRSNKIKNEHVKMRNECEVKRRPECVNRHYKMQTFLYEIYRIHKEMPPNEFHIFYNHNNMPDQITQHIEEITFIVFSEYFGGAGRCLARILDRNCYIGFVGYYS